MEGLRQGGCCVNVLSNRNAYVKKDITTILSRGRPIIGADIKHFTDYRYRPF